MWFMVIVIYRQSDKVSLLKAGNHSIHPRTSRPSAIIEFLKFSRCILQVEKATFTPLVYSTSGIVVKNYYTTALS